MNDYTKGVLETIGFVLLRLKSLQSKTVIAKELEKIRVELLERVASDFRPRLSTRTL